MKGTDIISRARIVLNDADATRWTDAEFVNWINDACRFVAVLRPDSCVVNQAMALAAGTKQSIAGLTPAGLRLMDVVRNLPTGRAIRLVDRDVLDTQMPNWHGATQAPTTNYVFDNRDPKNFYVYPPAAAGAQVEVIYSRNPVEITVGTLATQDLSPDDIFMDAVLNFVLFRAYSKDATFAQNANLAASYRGLAEALLGGKTGVDAKFSPDFNSAGGKPTAAAASGGL